MAKVATEFESIIHAGRERKQAEALAASIFNRGRRAEPPRRTSSPGGGSLASRVGVQKRTSSTNVPRRSNQQYTTVTTTPGNVNGEWTHDLHKPDVRNAPSGPAAGSLAARITTQNGQPISRQATKQARRAEQIGRGVAVQNNAAAAPPPPQHPKTHNVAAARGMSIRGLAGPYVVMAQNFAPGTTAADIESAMTPIGGMISSCKLLKTSPFLLAEIVFESKEGAENVVQTFDGQTADGRTLKVYAKLGVLHLTPSTAASTPTAPRAMQSTSNTLVDGTMGFDDPMDVEPTPAAASAPRGPRGGAGRGGGRGAGGAGGSRRGRGGNGR